MAIESTKNPFYRVFGLKLLKMGITKFDREYAELHGQANGVIESYIELFKKHPSEDKKNKSIVELLI